MNGNILPSTPEFPEQSLQSTRQRNKRLVGITIHYSTTRLARQTHLRVLLLVKKHREKGTKVVFLVPIMFNGHWSYPDSSKGPMGLSSRSSQSAADWTMRPCVQSSLIQDLPLCSCPSVLMNTIVLDKLLFWCSIISFDTADNLHEHLQYNNTTFVTHVPVLPKRLFHSARADSLAIDRLIICFCFSRRISRSIRCDCTSDKAPSPHPTRP